MKSDAPKTSPQDLPEPLAPLMVDARDAAKLAGISSATWHRMTAAGKTPAPSRGCIRWRVADEDGRHGLEALALDAGNEEAAQ